MAIHGYEPRIATKHFSEGSRKTENDLMRRICMGWNRIEDFVNCHYGSTFIPG